MRILLGGIDKSDTEVVNALPPEAVNVFTLTVDELLESITMCSPDIIVVNSSLPGIFGALHNIKSMLPAPVVMIASSAEESDVTDLSKVDILGYLVRPITSSNLIPALQVACAQFQRLSLALDESAQLRMALASRKIIDRAKGLIMENRKANESEAYAFLRDESRRNRIPLVEVAKTIIEQAELPILSKPKIMGARRTVGRSNSY